MENSLSDHIQKTQHRERFIADRRVSFRSDLRGKCILLSDVREKSFFISTNYIGYSAFCTEQLLQKTQSVRIYRSCRHTYRHSPLWIQTSREGSLVAPVRHTYTSTKFFILSCSCTLPCPKCSSSRGPRARIYSPLLLLPSPELLGSRARRPQKVERGNGKYSGRMGLMFFSRSWICPCLGYRSAAVRPSRSLRHIYTGPDHQMKDRASPGPYFLFPGEPKAQMGGVHVPDADLLRPLRLDASRYRPSGTQVFR